MKFFILALFSLILAVSSESETSKTKTIKDQKTDNSAFLQKFLTPLNHDVNQRYGMNYGTNYGMNNGMNYGMNNGMNYGMNNGMNYGMNNGMNYGMNNGMDYGTNYGMNGQNYYGDNQDEDYREDYLSNDGGSRISSGPLYNKPNIWGYSRNGGGLGSLVSHSYNGHPNVWGYLRNSEGRRNMDVSSKNGGKQGNLENVNVKPGYMRHINMMGPRNKGYRNMGYGNMGYGNMGYGNGKSGIGNIIGNGNMGLGNMGNGNMDLSNMLQNFYFQLEPNHIGYVGFVDPRERGIKERYYYKLIGRRGLGFDRRTATSYGLTAPITPSLLRVSGRKYYNRGNNYYD